MYLTVLYPDAIEAEKHMNEYCYSGEWKVHTVTYGTDKGGTLSTLVPCIVLYVRVPRGL